MVRRNLAVPVVPLVCPPFPRPPPEYEGLTALSVNCGGFEIAIASLGASRVQIPPPPLNKARRPQRRTAPRLRRFRRPHRPVHGRPSTSAEMQWLECSLANDWRTDRPESAHFK